MIQHTALLAHQVAAWLHRRRGHDQDRVRQLAWSHQVVVTLTRCSCGAEWVIP